MDTTVFQKSCLPQILKRLHAKGCVASEEPLAIAVT